MLLEGDEHAVPEGFGLYLVKSERPSPGRSCEWLRLPPQLDHLSPGDVIALGSDGLRIRVLWRNASRQNSVLLTERCDNYCLMCSQPPKEQPDDHLLADAVELVRLLPQTTEGIGFTGGEPTLLGDGFFTLLRLCRNLLPSADVHILSNGRRFADPAFATAYAAVDNPRMMVGIPLYGPEPSTHDHVVQARNGFDETVRGILNLATLRQRIEVRVVLQRQTARVLVETAEFIARNLPFVDQVALMGLEIMGFARANLDQVWIDPIDYQEALAEATWLLHEAKLRVMIYNHQLCVLDASLWPFAVRSISDWKNEFHPECETCAVRPDCGGFFSSARHRRSRAIAAVQPASVGGTRASGRTDGVRSTNQPPRSAPRAAALPSR